MRSWLNNLGLDRLIVDLCEELFDPMLFLKVIAKLTKGILDEKKVSSNATATASLKRAELWEYILQIAQGLSLQIDGITAKDLAHQRTNAKSAFALMDLFFMYDVIHLRDRLRPSAPQCSVEQIVEWANDKVSNRWQRNCFADRRFPHCRSFLFRYTLLAS